MSKTADEQLNELIGRLKPSEIQQSKMNKKKTIVISTFPACGKL